MELNKSNILRILGIVFASVILFVGLQHYADVRNAADKVLAVLFPFILGGAIAFIINVPMRGIEKLFLRIFSGKKKPVSPQLVRVISLLITLLLVAGVITAVVFLVVPEIINSVNLVIDKYPDFAVRAEKTIADLSVRFPAVREYIDNYTIDWSNIGSQALAFFKNAGGTFFGSAIGVASSVFGAVANVLIAFVFAFNILLEKETLCRQTRKIVYAFLPEHAADKAVSIAALSNKTFSNFLSGQCLEICILGSLIFVSMTIFQLPYAALISILVAVLALIPMIGAGIGCVLGVFFILIVNPMQALWFLILFLVVQQIEGNLIYPKVVGKSIGLPPMWVLFALVIGGNILGIAGMLIFIPLSSVLYVLFRELVNTRLARRMIGKEKWKP